MTSLVIINNFSGYALRFVSCYIYFSVVRHGFANVAAKEETCILKKLRNLV